MTIEELTIDIERSLQRRPGIPAGLRPHVSIEGPDIEKRKEDGSTVQAGDRIVVTFEPDAIRRKKRGPMKFKPVPIRGEPISDTVIRDRG